MDKLISTKPMLAELMLAKLIMVKLIEKLN
jgi:hypothetical protein